MREKTRFWVFSGIFVAIVFVVTYSIRIPLFTGYFNIGDVLIMIAAILFGKNIAFLAGSFGSALSDIVSGYAVYAPITFLVKGFEGYICAIIFNRMIAKNNNIFRFIIPTIISGIFMAMGYFVSEAFLLKYLSSAFNINRDLQFGLKAAFINLPFNLLQGILSSAISSFLALPLYNKLFY